MSGKNIFECPACRGTNNTIRKTYYDGEASHRVRVCECGMQWGTIEVIETPHFDREEFDKKRNEERRTSWKAEGLCARCGKPNDSEKGTWCNACREYRAIYRKKRIVQKALSACNVTNTAEK